MTEEETKAIWMHDIEPIDRRTPPGRPSLYNICQKLYEYEWDETEKIENWHCICGYLHHYITFAGTPLLFKKVDGATAAIYGIRVKNLGLMPKSWGAGFMPGKMSIMGKVFEALGS
jgi:hypothetical protein